MKRQRPDNERHGTGTRDQGSESLKHLLRQALPPAGADVEPQRDLWPAMQQRLTEPARITTKLKTVPWFDWALAGALALFALAFPASVPMLLYYL
jgi:hypothetical protein